MRKHMSCRLPPGHTCHMTQCHAQLEWLCEGPEAHSSTLWRPHKTATQQGCLLPSWPFSGVATEQRWSIPPRLHRHGLVEIICTPLFTWSPYLLPHFLLDINTAAWRSRRKSDPLITAIVQGTQLLLHTMSLKGDSNNNAETTTCVNS